MKTRTVLLILALIGIVTSCIPSLYPLYRAKDLISDQNLEGFYPDGKDDFWMFSKLDIEGDLEGDWKNLPSAKMENRRILPFICSGWVSIITWIFSLSIPIYSMIFWKCTLLPHIFSPGLKSPTSTLLCISLIMTGWKV